MSATDNFRYTPGSSTDSASNAVTVVPSDDTDLPFVTRAVYVGGDGLLAVIMASGENVEFHEVPAGSLLPIRVSRILDADTTATNIVALE